MIITTDGKAFYIQLMWSESKREYAPILISVDEPLGKLLSLSDDEFAKLIED